MPPKKPVPKPHLRTPAIPKQVPSPKQFRPPTGSTGLLRVRFSVVDIDGPWCLSRIEPDHHRDLLQRIRSLESMACNQLFAPDSETGKTYEVEKIPNQDAINRLVELKYDDQTEIARLRINGKRRLYGFLPDGGPDFYALWWDPQHEIWPTSKKNT